MKLRRSFVLSIAAVAASVAAFAPAASAGVTKAPCAGTVVTIPDMSTFEARQAGAETFVEFDFTGSHPLCFADGTQVTATIAGHLVQHTKANGDLTLRFDGVLSYAGSTIGFRGEASLSGSHWQSYVQTVGSGTGALTGANAHGRFFPTATPGVLTDSLVWIWH